jgi:alkylation response protein AidB-like acyl-CoA dehydrogenase
MSYAISPISKEGTRLIGAAESLIEPFRSRSYAADRANEIDAENYHDLQRVGIASAFVPEELGGFGLQSIHDWMLTIVTLARGDGSAAIAISMHLSATRGLADLYHRSEPSSAAYKRAKDILEAVARKEMLICSTTTERGNDNLHPLTEVTACEEGWRLNGAKNFVTMSSLATHVATNVRMRDQEGDYIANVLIPMDTEGVVQLGDWDALGMRASGSQSVKFENCLIPNDAIRKIGPWGAWSIPVLVNRTLANVPLVGAFLGIGEAAMVLAIEGRKKASDTASRPGVANTLAEMEIMLATSQSILGRHGECLDRFMRETNGGVEATYEQSHEIMKDYQTAKWVVNRNAIDIVSGAMDLSGGGGFMAHNPLSRLYRDVRAGPFMQPHSPIDARDYIGDVLLGMYPEA